MPPLILLTHLLHSATHRLLVAAGLCGIVPQRHTRDAADQVVQARVLHQVVQHPGSSGTGAGTASLAIDASARMTAGIATEHRLLSGACAPLATQL